MLGYFFMLFSDCFFGRCKCCISDKTAYTSTFDFGNSIDEFALLIGKVNERFFPSPGLHIRRDVADFSFVIKQMVPPKFSVLSHSTAAVSIHGSSPRHRSRS